MLLRYYNTLTQALFNQYGNRKEQGIISFFYDVEEKAFLPIPPDTEHADFVSKIFHIEKNSLKFDERPKRLIPIIIKMDENFNVSKILIGVSGLEIGYGVRHSKKDLVRAKRMTVKFVKYGEFKIKKPLYLKLEKKYSQN